MSNLSHKVLIKISLHFSCLNKTDSCFLVTVLTKLKITPHDVGCGVCEKNKIEQNKKLHLRGWNPVKVMKADCSKT